MEACGLLALLPRMDVANKLLFVPPEVVKCNVALWRYSSENIRSFDPFCSELLNSKFVCGVSNLRVESERQCSEYGRVAYVI